MANTEGMSDEVVESLLGPSLSTGPPSNNTSSDEAAAARRRRVLEDRMSMSMGERPAARVVRASGNNGGRIQTPHQIPEPTATTAEEENPAVSDQAPPPIMGDIVERRQGNNNPQHAPLEEQSTAKKRTSRFAQQRQQFQANSSSTGFPSVNIPMGTFVKPKSKQRNNSNSTTNDTSDTMSTTQSTTSNPSSMDNTFRSACRQDADAMLAQMSHAERFEKAQELKAAMSPDMLGFLQRRAASKNKNNTAKTSSLNSASPVPQQAVPRNNATSNKDDQKTEETLKAADGLESTTLLSEKERIAKIMSSIKTFDDLDSAYTAEMGNFSPDDTTNKDKGDEADWKLACDLLRSTAQRQNLWAAKVVSERLQQQFERGEVCSVVPGTDASPWPYPVMLPASLRCLLDASFLHTNGYVLHTYALQALYTLLKLRACSDHVVDVTNVTTSSTLIYQEYFLDDAVPTPPLGACYQSIAKIEPLSTPGATGAAYKTSSSSTSAQQDGEAFAKDPMWTLLSRMCILPRIAQLLSVAEQHNRGGSNVVPKEAIASICGILAMVGQRSPGAASAIANHPSILKSLLKVTVEPRGGADKKDSVDNSGSVDPTATQGSPPYDPRVALPTIILLCSLARQSRVAASVIPFDDFAPPLLALKASTQEEHALQRWSIILWRILLRYGLGVPQIPIMLTLAASHMTLGFQTDSFSLSTEFSAAFANVLHCVQIARRASSKLGTADGKNSFPVIIAEQQDTLLHADGWMASSVQQTLVQLEWSPILSEFVGNSTGQQQDIESSSGFLDLLYYFASRLQFQSLALKARDEKVQLSIGSDETKPDDLLLSSTTSTSCQRVLLSLLERGILEQAFSIISPSAFVLSFAEIQDKQPTQSLKAEATACAFVCSFASLQLTLLGQTMDLIKEGRKTKDAPEILELSAGLDRIMGILAKSLAGSNGEKGSLWSTSNPTISVARIGWLNRACFAVVELLMAVHDFSRLVAMGGAKASMPFRELQFLLIGRLQRGDEALAAILFGQDGSVDPTVGESVLSSVLFRQLCGSIAARRQLDHSFKLRRGPGIKADEYGPFKLNSLLSEADDPQPGQNHAPDFVLPLGRMWLWQVLSSSIRSQAITRPHDSEIGTETVEVLVSCLNSIVKLESNNKPENQEYGLRYAPRIPSGAKAYHLVNISLHPESVLQNDGIVLSSNVLFDIYLSHVDEAFVLDFVKACVLHSGLEEKPRDSKDAEAAVKEKLASQLLDPLGADSAAHSVNVLGGKELRSLEQFVGDLCDVYMQYGAQYDLFTRFMLLFLRPAFPSKVRCLVLNRLGDIIHRLPLSGEDDTSSSESRSKLAAHLTQSIGSGSDPPDFLNAYATVYSQGGSPQLSYGYVLLLGILVFSRQLSSCLQPESLGLEAAKKRLGLMDEAFVAAILDATQRFIKSKEKSSEDLVSATLDAAATVCASSNESDKGLDLSHTIEQMKMLVL